MSTKQIEILIEAARITKGSFWRKFKNGADLATQIKELFNRANDMESETGARSQTEDDFDTFLERVERGFTDAAGTQDPTHPYGRDYEERPRIRELGQDDVEGEL